MNYLVSDVLDDAAIWLGDPAQDRFDNAECLPGFRNGYGDMVRLMRKWKLPEVERDLFTVVSPYTGFLRPAALADDFAVPIALWERGTPTSVIITSVSAARPIVVQTASPHGRATNDEVQLTGVDKSVDDTYYVTVIDSTHFSLNGTIGVQAYTAGTVVYSGEDFVEVEQVLNFEPISAANASSTIGVWHWMKGQLYLRPCTATRELQVHFRSSGAPPLTGYLGFDDARDFLSHATAMYVAKSNGMPDMAASERLIAYGPTGQADGRGGILRDICLPMLHQKMAVARRPQPFRPRQIDPARGSIYQ